MIFEVGDRVRAGLRPRYGRTDDGRITRVDSDGTVWGTFDDGGTFVREGRMVRDLERIEK